MDSGGRANRNKYECLLFDMDDTLYPLSSGLNLACRKNIEDFMLNKLHIEENEVPRICLELYREYGTTMAGLKALGYEFDIDKFHAFVHGRLPYDNLKPDPVLRSLLLSVPQLKLIFTNSDQAHAAEVVKRLGLEDCFEGVICFETLNPPAETANYIDATDNDAVLAGGEREPDGLLGLSTKRERYTLPILCKPSLDAFEAAVKIANVDPRKTIFFDDSTRNIATAKAAGLHTAIVGSSVPVPGADHTLKSIHNIREAIPDIWQGVGGEQLEQEVIQSAAVETAVLA